jgi:PAS domain-containing protein
MNTKATALMGSSPRNQTGPNPYGGVSLLIGCLAAFTVVVVAYALRFQVAAYLLVPGAILAFFGLLFLLGVMAGILVLPGRNGQQKFYDAVADASGNAFVVMDAQGRAIYANAPYTALAAKSGAQRLVGFDVLYAGKPEFATPVYQLVGTEWPGHAPRLAGCRRWYRWSALVTLECDAHAGGRWGRACHVASG